MIARRTGRSQSLESQLYASAEPVIEQHDLTSSRKIVRAAQYVRMSTEHQQYSTENQAEVIARYAAEHGMEIVATYADSGKSGLTPRRTRRTPETAYRSAIRAC